MTHQACGKAPSSCLMSQSSKSALTRLIPFSSNLQHSNAQVSGTSDYLRNDLNSSMSLVGRIPPKTAWDYIEKISKNPQKEILVLRFGPQNNDEVLNSSLRQQYLPFESDFRILTHRKLKLIALGHSL